MVCVICEHIRVQLWKNLPSLYKPRYYMYPSKLSKIFNYPFPWIFKYNETVYKGAKKIPF